MTIRETIRSNKQAQYNRECEIAKATHAAALAAVGPIHDDMELFVMFNVECGDELLWEFRKSTGGRDCVDKTALTPAELNRKQDAERAERVDQLRSLLEKGAMGHVESDDDCITDLLPKPIYV